MKKKVLVIGAKRSGLAATKFLAEHDFEVILTDMQEPSAEQLSELKGLHLAYIWGEQPKVDAILPDFIVISPGIPLSIPPVVRAHELGIGIVGETEIAFRCSRAPFIAITGTNGKTTTTTLLGELLAKDGHQVLVGGNIGLPLITMVEALDEEDLVVAEMSSFQLDTTLTFKPKVALMLNLTPDHLDRHGDMATYLAAKAKITANQDENDFLVLNRDDPNLVHLAKKTKAHVIFFSQQNRLEEGVYLEEDQIVVDYDGKRQVVSAVEDLGIRGKHNLENAMGAIGVAIALGVPIGQIAGVLKSFKGVAHRLEMVRIFQGVTYINDSKGTNPDATIKALEAYDEPIVAILGGKNKGSDFSALLKVVAERAKHVVLLGEAKGVIEAGLKTLGYQAYEVVETLEEAVLEAKAQAKAGDVVLFSPACASWDMFSDYEERGNLFKALVNGLK